ncbi:MAG: TIGR02147 family protein [Bdellovibrionaceae bacterium]|nr:TIGR02147 family protein [Pseudobdellovibrionaceae bacterium]
MVNLYDLSYYNRMNVFEFRDYKVFLNHWIKEHPKGGRGQLKKMADYVGVSTTLISQVLKADKHFSMETAAEITEYIGLNNKETEYFLLLIEHQRAGAFKLKKILEKRLEREQSAGAQLKNRLKTDRQLSDDEKMQFYSSWMYSAIRILSAVPEMIDAKTISERLNIPLGLTSEIINFLLEKNLCVIENNKLTYGAYRTHIGKDSPFAVKHHQNWRLKGFQPMELRRDEDLFFTQPMALSKDAAEKIRLMLPGIIEQLHSIGGPSESEVVRCLNIDWFEY